MPKSAPGFSWIRETLDLYNRRLKPEEAPPDLSQGFDINGDGVIADNEKPKDLNNNGVFDPEEWQDFLQRNPELRKPTSRISFFKWGAKLDPTNPLHDLLAIEAKEVPEEAIKASYDLVTAIVTRVHDEAIRHQDWTPQQKLQAIHRAIKEEGIELQDQVDPLFSTHVVKKKDKKKTIDCDNLGFLVLAVAHDMKWPIFLVRLRNHTFVRWYEEGTISLNMDNGVSLLDESYRTNFSVAKSSERKHVYMTNMDRQELVALSVNNCGIAKARLGDYPHAIEDFTQAIELDPKLADAFYNRGLANAFLLNDRAAIKDFTAAIELDPNFSSALYARGVSRINLNDPKNLEDAAADLKNAAQDPEIKSRAEEALKELERRNPSQGRR